jgi:beta-lactamase superfamily II metal-dependent hydrolase
MAFKLTHKHAAFPFKSAMKNKEEDAVAAAAIAKRESEIKFRKEQAEKNWTEADFEAHDPLGNKAERADEDYAYMISTGQMTGQDVGPARKANEEAAKAAAEKKAKIERKQAAVEGNTASETDYLLRGLSDYKT